MGLHFKDSKPAKKAAKPEKTEVIAAPNTGTVSTTLATLESIAQQIEKASMESMHGALSKLKGDARANNFEMGGRLRRIANGFNSGMTYQGCDNFKAYIATHYKFTVRHAYNLMMIYTNTLESGIDPELLFGVEHSKLRLLVGVMNAQTAPKWIAEAENLTFKELQAKVKLISKEDVEDVEENPTQDDKGNAPVKSPKPPKPLPAPTKAPIPVDKLIKPSSKPFSVPNKKPVYTAAAGPGKAPPPPANGIIPHTLTPETAHLEHLANALKPIKDWKLALDVLQARYPNVVFDYHIDTDPDE